MVASESQNVGAATVRERGANPSRSLTVAARSDPAFVRWGLTLLELGLIGVLIVVPVANVFAQALANGPAAYWNNLVGSPETLHAIRLTLIVAAAAVLLNTVF